MSFSLVAVAAKWVALSPSAVVARTLERGAMFCLPAVICKCMLVPVLQAVAMCLYGLVLATLVAVCRFRRLHRRKPPAEMWLFLQQTAPVAVVVSPAFHVEFLVLFVSLPEFFGFSLTFVFLCLEEWDSDCRNMRMEFFTSFSSAFLT